MVAWSIDRPTQSNQKRLGDRPSIMIPYAVITIPVPWIREKASALTPPPL
jgi:hypothetical protein